MRRGIRVPMWLAGIILAMAVWSVGALSQTKEATKMNPKAVQRDGFTVMGIAIRTSNAEQMTEARPIGKQWESAAVGTVFRNRIFPLIVYAPYRRAPAIVFRPMAWQSVRLQDLLMHFSSPRDCVDQQARVDAYMKHHSSLSKRKNSPVELIVSHKGS